MTGVTEAPGAAPAESTPVTEELDAAPAERTPVAEALDAAEIVVAANGRLIVRRGDTILAEVDAPCPVQALARGDGRLYAACGSAGVAVLSMEDPASLRLESFVPVPGAAVGFFNTGESLWVHVRREEAHPLLAGPVGTAPAALADRPVAAVAMADPAAMEPLSRTEARIVSYRAGEATIDAGREAGLREGDRVEVLVRHQVVLPAMPGEEPALAEVDERAAVAVVVATADDRSLLRLGVGERARPGDRVVATNLPTSESILAPPRLGGLGEVAFAFRPFLVLDLLGIGSVNEAAVTWRTEAPWYGRVRVLPLGVALAAEESNLFNAAWSVGGGFDTRYFGLGLGLGMSAVNSEPRAVTSSSSLDVYTVGGRRYVPEFRGVHNKFGISQEVRLGARDGLNLEVYNTFIRFAGAFRYSGTNVALFAPVTSRTTVLAGGGGGLAGFGYGELGVRSWVRGNGDEGSLALGTSAGWGFLFGNIPADEDAPEDSLRQRDRSVELTGPIVSVHGIWRFGF